MTAALHPNDPENEYARNNSVLDPRDFRKALGHYATGVTVITTAGENGELVGLTCNSFASVSLNPPLILWSLVSHSPNMVHFQNASHFAVNVLAASERAIAKQFATPAKDKFAGVSWTRGLGNAPILTGTVATFQCRSADRYYGGDHVIFLGAVEAYQYNGGEPLLFALGGFGQFVAES